MKPRKWQWVGRRRGTREGRGSQSGRREGSQRVMEGEGFRREDASNRWRMMKTDIMVDRRASIIVDLSKVTEVETRFSLLLEDCMGMSARRQL